MKVQNESNKFLKGDSGVGMMLEVGREKESVGINEVSADSSNFFWCTIRTRCGQIIQPLLNLMDEMGNAVAKMSYYVGRKNQGLFLKPIK